MKHIKEVFRESVRPILKEQIEQNVKTKIVIEECIAELKRLKASLEKVTHEMGD